MHPAPRTALLLLGAVALGWLLGRAGEGLARRRAGEVAVCEAGFALPEAGRYVMHVRVRQADGRPAPEMTVRAVRGDADVCADATVYPSAPTDDRGRALLTVPAPGTYRVEATRGCGAAYGAAEGVQVAADRPVRVQVRLEADDADGWRVARLALGGALLRAPSGVRFQARLQASPPDELPQDRRWASPGPYGWSVVVPPEGTTYGVVARLAPDVHASLAGAALTTVRAAAGDGPRWRIVPSSTGAAADARRWLRVQVHAATADGARVSARTRLQLAVDSPRGGRWRVPLQVQWFGRAQAAAAEAVWWLDPRQGPWTLHWAGPGVEPGAAPVPLEGDAPRMDVAPRVGPAGLTPELAAVDVTDERGRAVEDQRVELWARERTPEGGWQSHGTTWPPSLPALAGRVVTPVVGPWRVGAATRLPASGRAHLAVAPGGYVLLHLLHPPAPGLGRLTVERVDGGWVGALRGDDLLGPVDEPDRLGPSVAQSLGAGSLLGPLPAGRHVLRFRLGGIEVGTCSVPVRARRVGVLVIR
jgi:hypothetical protein